MDARLNEILTKGKQILEETKILYELSPLECMMMALLMEKLPPIPQKSLVKVLKGLAHMIENTEVFSAELNQILKDLR